MKSIERPGIPQAAKMKKMPMNQGHPGISTAH
jgi:hypothetical protein